MVAGGLCVPKVASITAADLRRVSIFAQLDDAAREYLARHTRLRSYPRGTFLFFQDEPAEKLYFVVSGAVRVFEALPDGREFTYEHLGPWEVLAAVCFFDGGPYPATAQTLAASVIGEIEEKAMERLIAERPEVARACLVMLGERLRRAHRRSTDLAVRDVHERLAAVLLDLDAGLAQGPGRELPGRSGDLALMIGAARETVARALQDFARQGAVRVERGRVTVLDRRKLALWTEPRPPSET